MYDKFDALIFDMDGTLVDSGQLHEKAWAATLNNFSIPIDRALMRSLAGVPTLGTLEILIDKFQCNIDEDITKITQYKERYVHEHIHAFVKPTALIELALTYHLKKPMAIGTGATTLEAQMILKICKLDHLMDAIVGADQVANPKPAPDTFLRCAQLLGAKPENCVVFEDSQLGLQAAAHAGMTGIDVLISHAITNNYFL